MTNPYLRQTLIEVVENQLRDGTPPETRQTLERLMAAGHSRERAIELITGALAGEIWFMLHEKSEHDRERYRARLDELK